MRCGAMLTGIVLGKMPPTMPVLALATVRQHRAAHMKPTEIDPASLLASVREALVATDLEGQVVYWGPGARELYGLEAEDAVGRHLGFLYPGEGRAEAEERLARTLQEGSWRGETLQRRRGGASFTARSSLTLVRDEEGEPRGFLAVSRDVSQEVEARQALEASEERFRRAFEHGPLGLAIVRKDQTILRANEALCAMFECTEAELVGHVYSELTHAEDRDEEVRLSRQVFRGEIPGFTLEKRYLTTTREARWARVTGTAIHGADGRPRYGLMMAEDITRRKRSGEIVRRSERLASIGTFAAGVAHQINNPLGGILMAAQFGLASRDDPDGPVILEQSLRDIEADAQRCSEIVKGVLRFARQDPADRERCDPVELVRRTVEEVRQASSDRVSLEVVVPEASRTRLLAHRADLEEAVRNVVRNAAESRDDAVTVKVTLEETPGVVRIIVRDDGHGIEERHRHFLFDPFFTTRRDRGGTGLGLSLAHAVVTSHGGSIDIDSSPGEGTTVIIELPAAGEATVP